MTLIIAAKKDKNILLGVDSRALVDTGVSRVMTNRNEKLTQLNKFCSILIAGDAEKGIFLIEQFKSQINEKEDVVSISNNFSKFCKNEFKPLMQFMSVSSDYYPDIVFIITGFDRKNNPRIFVLRSKSAFAIGEKRDYAIEGVHMISLYLFAKSFDKINSMDKLIELITRCLCETEMIDGNVGGKKYVAQIDIKYGFKFVPIEQIVQDIENEGLKNIIEDN